MGRIMEDEETEGVCVRVQETRHKQKETNKQKLKLQSNLVSILLEIAWI